MNSASHSARHLPIIEPLVSRHSGDAAFYWSQLENLMHSPLANLAQLAQFERLLTAHLDGLRVAAEAGWQRALTDLERWQGTGEAFVCTRLALESDVSGARLKQVWEIVSRDLLRMQRGLICALACSEEQSTGLWLGHWLGGHETPPALQAVALEAACLLPELLTVQAEALTRALASPEASLRAAACRFLAHRGEHERIVGLLSDQDRGVRAEAAIALSGSGSNVPIAVLVEAVMAQTQVFSSSSGRPRRDALQVLERWVRHLALSVPQGHGSIEALLHGLPVRQALSFILHHGDLTYLPMVTACFNHPEAARLAGWIWASLTGVDLTQNRLCHPAATLEGEPRPTDDLDPGLPEPDEAAILAYLLAVPGGYPFLLGLPLSGERLPEILHCAPLALYWIARQRLLPGKDWRQAQPVQLPQHLSRIILLLEKIA